MKSHTTAVLLATAACLAVLAHPAAAGCDKVVQAGEVVHYKSMDANSYCFNGTAMPSGMNAFEAKISNTKSPTGDLCGIWTSDCTGDSQAALGSCGLDTGASLFYAYRCHNRAKCSDYYYLGFFDGTESPVEHEFDFTVNYVSRPIC